MSTMTRAILIFIIFSSSMPCAPQQSTSDLGPLVRITVQREKYCLGEPGPVNPEHQPPDAITLRLKVTADYLNTGKAPLIIPTTHHLSTIIVSRVQRLGEAEHFTIHIERRQKPSNELPSGLDVSKPLNPLFAIVQPGKGLDVPFGEYVVLQVHNPSSPSARTELLGQKLFLRLEVAHEELSSNLAEELARKWKRYGHLWRGKVVSEPIEVDVPISPGIADCSHEYKM